MPFRAAYLDRFLARQVAARTRGRPLERFLHLGHWDDPSVADGDILAAQQRLNQLVLEMAAVEDGTSVLDVGCGVGGTLASLAERFPAVELTGLNIDPRQLALAREIVPTPLGGTLRLDEGDACSLPYAGATFDCVLAVECAFHFSSRSRFFAEVSRVLRPNGRLVLTDFLPAAWLRDRRSDPGWVGGRVRERLEAGLGPWPDFWGEEPALETLLAAAGLELVERRNASANTLPSYSAFTTPPDGESVDDGQPTAVDESVALLGRLQAMGAIDVVYVSARPVRPG
jgi:SAM-dependent methyltransferase